MDCTQALNNMDFFLGRALSSHETLALQRHLDSCPVCQEEFRQEEELLTALRSLPVPQPSVDFVKRSFATARDRHKQQRAKQAIPLWGGAVAAGLALWLMVVSPLPQTLPPTQLAAQHAITFKINEQRLVQVVVDAPRDMLQAAVIIALPPEVEMAGFPGLREIRWNTNLRQGKNLLSLPLIAKSEGIAELITHITYENKCKMLSLVMNISHDELTETGHYTPTTA